MNTNLSQDLGENYEYVKVILRNRVELAKLDLIETTAEIGALLICIAVLSVACMIVLICALIMIGLWLSAILGSTIYALGTIALFFLISMILLYVFRKVLIINPFVNTFYKKYVKA